MQSVNDVILRPSCLIEKEMNIHSKIGLFVII